MARFSAVFMFLFLGGCASQQPVYVRACPVVPQYSISFEKTAAQQLAQLPPNSPLVQMINDYGAVRREVRDCR